MIYGDVWQIFREQTKKKTMTFLQKPNRALLQWLRSMHVSLANRSWRRKNVAAVLWKLEFVQFARTYVWYPFVDECASLNLAYPMPKRSFEKLYIFDQYLEHVQSWKLYKHEPFNNVTKHAHPTHWKKSKLRGIHRGLTEPTLEHQEKLPKTPPVSYRMVRLFAKMATNKSCFQNTGRKFFRIQAEHVSKCATFTLHTYQMTKLVS